MIRVDVCPRLVVLAYHHVAEAFGDHLEAVPSRVPIVSLSDGLASLSSRHSGPMLALTFDDGYASVTTHALPVLKDRAAPATLFVPSAVIGAEYCYWWDEVDAMIQSTSIGELMWLGSPLALHRPSDRASASRVVRADVNAMETRARLENMDWLRATLGRAAVPESRRIMSWGDISLASDAGVEIASHGATHQRLNSRDVDLAFEVAESKANIEDRVGKPVRGLAYPYGGHRHFGPAVIRAAQSAGYDYAVTTIPGMNFTRQDRFKLRRYLVRADERPSIVHAMATGVWEPLRALVRARRTLSPFHR